MSEQAKPNWYPDPSGNSSKLRYWNGTVWTNDYVTVPIDHRPVTTGGTKTLLAAFIFAIITAVLLSLIVARMYYVTFTGTFERPTAFYVCISSLALIPFAWLIPMTARIWKIYKGEAWITMGFSICAFLFVSPFSGILLLVNKRR